MLIDGPVRLLKLHPHLLHLNILTSSPDPVVRVPRETMLPSPLRPNSRQSSFGHGTSVYLALGPLAPIGTG